MKFLVIKTRFFGEQFLAYGQLCNVVGTKTEIMLHSLLKLKQHFQQFPIITIQICLEQTHASKKSKTTDKGQANEQNTWVAKYRTFLACIWRVLNDWEVWAERASLLWLCWKSKKCNGNKWKEVGLGSKESARTCTAQSGIAFPTQTLFYQQILTWYKEKKSVQSQLANGWFLWNCTYWRWS